MKSESDGGEGRGLPVGVEWHHVEGTGGALLRPIKDPDDILAAARADGTWDVWGTGASRRLVKGTATPRPGETLLAAAQRESARALWARDGFGAGEVRGRLCCLPYPPQMGTTAPLPGLDGLWKVTRVRPVEGGVEVDAERAPVEPARREPVPYYDPVTMRCPHGTRHPHECRDGCEEGEPSPASSLWGVAAEMQGEPAPVDGADKMARVWEIARRWYVSPDGSDDARAAALAEVARVVNVAPAPSDGAELARLLPGLLDYCAAVLAEPDEDTRSRLGVGKHLASACDLLLAERAKTERRIAILMQTADAGEIAVGALERARARAEEAGRRVAELEAQVARSREQDRPILAGLRALEEQLEPLSLDGESAEATLARLIATPPPGTVAALQALITRAIDALTASGESLRGGSSEDMRAHVEHIVGKRREARVALEAARATLGAPHPLAGVVGEVCALLPREYPEDDGEPLIIPYVRRAKAKLYGAGNDANAGDPAGARVQVIDAIADLLAGMLACDAAKEGDK